MQVAFKKMHPNARFPERMSVGAAGSDIYVPYDQVVPTGRSLIKTGLAMSIPHGYWVEIRPRSGYSLKGMEGNDDFAHFDCDVKVGTIDEDYRGEVGVIVKNCGEPFVVKAGTRVAQMLMGKYEPIECVELKELSETERGEGGFGHSNER